MRLVRNPPGPYPVTPDLMTLINDGEVLGITRLGTQTQHVIAHLVAN